MPNNWQMVDSNFPTITGEEPVKEQIGKIIDYLSILTEQLQYQLQNLDSSNWNASALTELEQSAVERLATVLKSLESTVNALSGRISSAEGIVGRMGDAEESIAAQEEAIAELLEELDKIQDDVDALRSRISGISGKGDETTVGGEGKTVHLIGTVYINGVLQGEAEEEGTT